MRESVDSSERVAAVLPGRRERVDEQALGEPAVALVLAGGEPGDVPVRRRSLWTTACPTTAPSGSTTTRRFHGSKPGRCDTSAAKSSKRLALAHRPLEERVLGDRPARSRTPRASPRARRSRPAAAAPRSCGARGQLEHPAGPPHVVAERLEQPVARRALGHRHADDRRPRARGPCPASTARAGADAAAAVVGWTAASPAGRRSPRRTPPGRSPSKTPTVLPARSNDGRCHSADDVGLLDLDLADVVQLLGGHHLVHRGGRRSGPAGGWSARAARSRARHGTR